MIVINFKNYKTGKQALDLAKKIERYCKNAVVCVAAIDISNISEKTKLRVFAQHVSYYEPGRATGFVIPEFIKHVGASGSLLNHSEHKVPLSVIKKTMKHANKIGLKLIVCASSVTEARKIKQLQPKPFAIAYEDPHLVSSGKSITKFKTKDVVRFAKLLKGSGIIALCGAGINSKEDVAAAKKLGCKGVLIASAIVKAKRPEKLLREIC